MLTLTRRRNESILIGKDIELTIAELNSKQVKISFKAPKEIKIMRKEIASIPEKPAE
jgi:carbon storage regulator